jgi:hypothetical protein
VVGTFRDSAILLNQSAGEEDLSPFDGTPPKPRTIEEPHELLAGMVRNGELWFELVSPERKTSVPNKPPPLPIVGTVQSSSCLLPILPAPQVPEDPKAKM